MAVSSVTDASELPGGLPNDVSDGLERKLGEAVVPALIAAVDDKDRWLDNVAGVLWLAARELEP